MYNNPYLQNYMNNYGQQSLNERIDGQIAQLQQMKEQIKGNQQPAINQTFQLAPTNNHAMRYANTIDDVIKENVYLETPFFSKDMSIVWIKDGKGNIRTYELNEIIPKDAKDMQIEYLMSQIDELKGKIDNVSNVSNANAKQDTTNPPTNDEPIGKPIKESEPTSVSRISKSKAK